MLVLPESSKQTRLFASWVAMPTLPLGSGELPFVPELVMVLLVMVTLKVEPSLLRRVITGGEILGVSIPAPMPKRPILGIADH